MADFYCGPAPDPQVLATAWNLDGTAIALCAGLAVFRLVHPRPGGRLPFCLALGLLAVLYLSPLCALTVALFSARVFHHAVLIALVAPLLAIALPHDAQARPRLPLFALVIAHALIVWLWHAPALYEIGIRSAFPYWTMQLSLLGSAFLLWRRIVAQRSHAGPALLALLATAVQMGMLGALLVFARYPLYAPHLESVLSWGMSPLADQQLAGLIMWVPASLPYLIAAALLLAHRLDRMSIQGGRR